MNDPWNQLPRWPSTDPFGESVGSSATSPIPSGGILGNLGQTIRPPWMDSPPAPIAAAALGPLVGQPQSHPWSYRSPPEMYDAETLKFLTTWRRIYSNPLLPAAWPPTNPSQLRTPFGLSVQSFPAPAPDTSTSDVPERPPTPAPDFEGWRRSDFPTPSPQPDGVVNFAPPVGSPNSITTWRAASPPSRVNSGPMLGSDDSMPPSARSPTWDASRATGMDAGLDPEPPSRSSKHPSMDGLDARQSTIPQSPAEILSDVAADNLWIPGAEYAAKGHHEFPQALYKGMQPATRKVFEAEHTGKLLVRSIDGRRHENDAFHRQYSAAVGQILKDFMEANNISERPDLLTPDHARAV
jgi:hypothetical protein